jgi:hypothetical protein
MAARSTAGASGSAQPEGRESATGKIDLQALAEKIYRLLKEEARLERERLGRPQAR